MSACLLPQNDDPLPTIPPAKNRAPRIITPIPERFIQLYADDRCALPTVSAGVEDLDVGDRIRVKWAVYGEDGVRETPIDGVPGSFPPGMSVTRPSIVPPSTLFTTGKLRTTGRGRRLELVIADGEVVVGPMSFTTLPVDVMTPDGGIVANDTYVDVHSWIVDTSSLPCQ